MKPLRKSAGAFSLWADCGLRINGIADR